MLLEIVEQDSEAVLDTRTMDQCPDFRVGDLVEFYDRYNRFVRCTVFKRAHLLDDNGLRLYVRIDS
jgi:hypothetical protein